MISNQITGIKAAGHHLQRTPVYSYNPLSRTEDTIKREQDKKRRTLVCPAGLLQKFVTSNCVDFPCHPADEAQHSPYPIGFRGCYGRTGHHNFTDYPTKREPACYQKFHWNLHCHKPDNFSRIELVSSLVEKNMYGRVIRLNVMVLKRVPDNQM